MNINMKKKEIYFIIVATSVALLFSALGMNHVNKVIPAFSQCINKYQIIIDAGHGGMDGGAIGLNNVIEKNINLNISKKLETLLELNGFDIIMTRSDDISIHDKNITNSLEQKRSDMYNRLDIIEKYPKAIFVSIHQNKFEQSQSNGAQVFYSPNDPNSALLASSLQNSFKELLQPNNKRETKESGKELFLLYNAQIPAVLVECGFLSNPEECEKLVLDEYQSQVAFTIFNGIIKYINEREGMS